MQPSSRRMPGAGLCIDFYRKESYNCLRNEVFFMKKNSVLNTLYQLGAPVAVILLGILLVVSPDSASILVARILGWGLTLVGIGFGIAAILDRDRAVRKGVTAVIFACAGGWLTANPLLLAAWIGRIIGLLIIFRGIRDLYLANSYGYSRMLALITTAVGAVLVVLPLTASRLVFSLCGVLVLLLGVGMLADRLKHPGYLPKGDSDIIDAL